MKKEVLVVGAGPAGLAVSALLEKRNIPFRVLEKQGSVGAAWRNHYERLHLHTVKEHSHLPMKPFPEDYPRYVPRDLLVKYMEDYAEEFNIRPQFNEEVLSASKTDSGWKVASSKEEYNVNTLIVCAGYNHSPKTAEWPGMKAFKGKIIHSRDYRNGAEFKGQNVLVVGAGNTGGEIAIDLHEYGAKPTICVRGPLHIVPREIFGVPMQLMSLLMDRLPLGFADMMSRIILQAVTDDLSEYGIFKPNHGSVSQVVNQEKIPLVDIGTVKLIKSGDLAVTGDIDSFTEDGVWYRNGRKESYEAVILCTGYKPALNRIFNENLELFNDKGYPLKKAENCGNGLYFLGYTNHLTGFLRYIGVEAEKIADELAVRESEYA